MTFVVKTLIFKAKSLEGLKILSCGSGIESQDKQKRSEALPLGESMTSEAQPISFAVGG